MGGFEAWADKNAGHEFAAPRPNNGGHPNSTPVEQMIYRKDDLADGNTTVAVPIPRGPRRKPRG